MHRSSLLLVLLTGTSAPLAPTSRTATPVRAISNDNREPAGVLRNGVLTIRLVAQQAAWYPEAEDGPFKLVEAFGEPGEAPRIPAPLMRVKLGTTINASITNSLADTLVVFGMPGRNDTLVIAPNDTMTVRFTPRAAGNFLYGASEKKDGQIFFGGSSGQLVGGLIVDADTGAARDRVFITTGWLRRPLQGQYFIAMNGKSWPYTEKFTHTVGDTVRWRVLNGGSGSAADHPMHLHGFYYRVDSRGGWNADTLYSAAQRRRVATENLPGLSSMTMTWVPERPGNWLFHCHNADHVAGRNRHAIAGRERPYPPIAFHDAHEHMREDMSGPVNAITILPRAGSSEAAKRAVAPREMRLLVQERQRYYGQGPGYGFVLQRGMAVPVADSINVPGSPLVLRRDETVAITLVNRLSTHTAVHWHGIELESFFDGVAGWSGAGDRRAPMIAPNDSFIARFTPPRAGTFIYHAHITDLVQLARGLYGALLVMPPNKPYLPESDHVMVVGLGRPNGKASMLLNGSMSPAPIYRRRDGTHRIRVINISPENNVILTVSADSALISWTPVAKDGFDLPAAQRRSGPARMQIFQGETYDFEFQSRADILHVRIKNPIARPGVDDVTQQLRVRP